MMLYLQIDMPTCLARCVKKIQKDVTLRIDQKLLWLLWGVEQIVELYAEPLLTAITVIGLYGFP